MKSMKRKKYPTALLVLGLASLILMLAAHQAAAFFKKKEAESKPLEAVNRQAYPLMVFKRGLLQGDVGGSWRLDDTPLILTRETRVSNASSSSQLQSGREAVVMGYSANGSLVVYQATIISAQQTMEQGRFYERRIDGQPQLASPNLPY